jgi:hypothetical protein
MRHLRKTRCNTRKKRKTLKKTTRRGLKGYKGGAEPCSKDTDFDKFVLLLWTKLQYELRDKYHSGWKFDIHKNKRFNTCNLWGWLKCHTTKEYDTHWDLYFIDTNTIGLSLTFEGEHNRVKDQIKFNTNEVMHNDEYVVLEEFVEELAEWIDTTYWNWVYSLDGWKREDC